MNFLKVIRSIEWWEYKLPPLLAIGYATAIKADGMFLKAMPQLVFLLLSLIVGAAYVSIINDITDIDDDLASGKSNRMAGLNPMIRWIFPAACVLAGLFCGYFLYPDWLSISLYTVPWISFSLYSFRPFRLKNRGIWGVFADAAGSHVFTSLFVISSISFFTNQHMDWLWFGSTGIWATCYGVRGILWHQFYDRKNDIKSNVNTFVVKIDPMNFRRSEIYIFIAEMLAISTMLYCIHELWPLLGLFLYLFLVFVRTYRLKYAPVIIIAPENRPYHILMADFYQIFFPLSILVAAVINEPYALIVMLLHFALFPKKTLLSFKDLRSFFSD